MSFKILSIDGGGIRGIIPARILVAVEKELQEKYQDPKLKIGDYFDFIAGTSTGGILACLYLAPERNNPQKARFSAQDALDLYLEFGDDIFDRGIWQKLISLGGMADEKYSAATLEKLLLQYFGDTKLSDLIKPCLITAYDVKDYRPFFFTRHNARQSDDRDFRVREVARATSAAPTYFEVAQADNLDDLPNPRPLVDGGVFAGNPTACALVEVISHNLVSPNISASSRITDLHVLSLGTGRKSERISFAQCRDWGLVGWARPLVGILLDGVSQVVDFQMKTIFSSLGVGGQYLRVDGDFNVFNSPGLDPAMDNADPANMERLNLFGGKLAQDNLAAIRAFI